MPLRIAFDLDGVLADMDGELTRHAARLFGARVIRRPENPPPPASPSAADEAKVAEDAAEPPLPTLELTDRQRRRLWQHVESIEGFWETLPELEAGLVSRLAATATGRRWEVIFVTKRPETVGATAQLQSQRWLESKGFRLPSVFVVQRSRGRIAEALGLDVVVDDRPENCLDVVVDSRARAILVWRQDERLLPAAVRRLGIGVVHSVAECLDILTKVDSAAEGDRAEGLFARLARALGLKGQQPERGQ